MPPATPDVDLRDWGLLVLLSVIWGGSYLFVGIAVRELSPLVVVLARVAIAAPALLCVHWWLQGPMPADRATWMAVAGMSVLNNIVPFCLIVTGQTMIASGLASVVNATTPLFGVAFLAAAGLEPLVGRKLVGILIGIAGVAVLKAEALTGAGSDGLGVLLCLGAAASYGLAGLWARKRLAGVPPLTAATGQLICSAAIMAVLAGLFDRPASLASASPQAWLALVGLALLATALAYIIFFRIVARSGAANVLLVTMLIPLSAILLGYAVLGETLDPREIAGAVVIVAALAVIDGRALSLLGLGDRSA